MRPPCAPGGGGQDRRSSPRWPGLRRAPGLGRRGGVPRTRLGRAGSGSRTGPEGTLGRALHDPGPGAGERFDGGGRGVLPGSIAGDAEAAWGNGRTSLLPLQPRARAALSPATVRSRPAPRRCRTRSESGRGRGVDLRPSSDWEPSLFETRAQLAEVGAVRPCRQREANLLARAWT